MRLKFDDTAAGGFMFEWLRTLSQAASGGALFGDCIAAANAIHDGDFASWTKVWAELAGRILNDANAAEASAHIVTAQGLYLRASNYYRSACFYAAPEKPEHRELFFASRSSFHRAIACGLPAEAIAIPFEGRTLPGYWLRGGRSPAPTLIAHGGFDSTAEELYHWIGVHAAARGWNCVIFEGPGQWGPVFDDPPLLMRPDWEVPVKAVVDWTLKRPEVDGEHLALIGYSLGGYLAPRAAALEPRIGACIASPLAVDIGGAFRVAWPAIARDLSDAMFDRLASAMARLSVTGRWVMQHARWSMGISTPHELFERTRPYTLHGLEAQLTCPLLVVLGEDDVANLQTPLVLDTIDFLARLSSRREVRIFTRATGGASHCQMEVIPAAAAAAMDWLVELNREPNSRIPMLIVPDSAIEMIRKHHGADAAAHTRRALEQARGAGNA